MSCKYVIIVPDGAADKPLAEFGGKTILEAAKIPNIDRLSSEGRQGLVQTVPTGMEPGSDVAQMSLLGYDPARYYTGRAPIEAVAMDIDLDASDWVFRCNLVTICDEKMADHSAGHITSEEGGKLIDELNGSFASETLRFHKGVSYRHLLVCKGYDFDVQTYPPHDYIGIKIEKILPRGKGADMLIDLMARSGQLFAGHDINRVRLDLGENQVSSIWLWGEGKRTVMDSFEKRFGLRGASITAVDLVRGLSKLIGFDLIAVEGATGFVDTNYEGKANAAIEALEKYDVVFVHVEGPDEAGHNKNAQLKKLAVERIDKYIVGPVYEALQKYPQWRMMVLPDHPTPVESGAHSSDAVPFAMAGSQVSGIVHKNFSESNSEQSGFYIDKGCDLMEYFLNS
ncbi:MAG: cofactor-independent phosphoglycerate mutase [Phycisphaerae bacterium]|nr:cofactor-independent phosphoglycerate mutase [Phycisphaerae bacterium]